MEEETFQQILTACHVYASFETTPIPIKDLKSRFSLKDDDIAEILPRLNSALSKRGLPLLNYSIVPVGQKSRELEFDPIFVLAADLLCDSLDKRSVTAKLKTLGLTSLQWKGMLRKKHQEEYFKKKLDQTWKSTQDSAKLALTKNVEAGDLQSIKYFNEWSGQFRPNEEMLLNIGILLGKVMEILAAHVEPAILATVADEIDLVLHPKELETINGN